MNNMTSKSFYSLAHRTIQMPGFFGAVLHRFREQENLTEQAVIHQLRTTRAMLARLALCRLPNSDSPEFVSQMRQIGAFTKIDVELLMRILRQVEAIDVLSSPRNIVKLERPIEEISSLESGFLAAARDRDLASETDKPDESDPGDQRK